LALFYYKVRRYVLFDLEKDPNELRNAYNDSKYRVIIDQMKTEILKQREMLGDMDEGNPEILEIITKHWNE